MSQPSPRAAPHIRTGFYRDIEEWLIMLSVTIGKRPELRGIGTGGMIHAGVRENA